MQGNQQAESNSAIRVEQPVHAGAAPNPVRHASRARHPGFRDRGGRKLNAGGMVWLQEKSANVEAQDV